MNRGRAALLSIAVAASAVAGLIAVHNSVALGSAQPTTAAQVARRSAQLDRYQASLVAALAKKPPALPQLPGSGTSASVPATARVLYQRAPSIVVAGGNREHEGESDDD
jgi:hypothetical protein